MRSPLTIIDGAPVYESPHVLPYETTQNGERDEVHCIRVDGCMYVSPQLADALRANPPPPRLRSQEMSDE